MWNNVQKAYDRLSDMSNRTVMQSSMMNMAKHLIDIDFSAHVDIEEQIILFDYASKRFKGMMKCEFRDKIGCVMLNMLFPIDCCEEKRVEMGRLLHMINYGSVFNPFEYDPRDGEYRLKYAHFCGDIPMSVVQAEHVIKLLLSTLAHYQETLIPFAMGMEPDYQKTCREYNEMKLSDMDAPVSETADEEEEEDEPMQPENDESADGEQGEEEETDEICGGEESENVDEDELEKLKRMIDNLFNSEQNNAEAPIEAQENEDFNVEDAEEVVLDADDTDELIDEEMRENDSAEDEAI